MNNPEELVRSFIADYKIWNDSAYKACEYGRDAADVAVYNQFGPPVYHKTQNIEVQIINKEET